MTLLVLGADASNLAQIRTLAAAVGGVRVVESAVQPDWIFADGGQRKAALERYRLPAFRVVAVEGLAVAGAIDVEAVRVGLTRVREIGRFRAPTSAAGLWLTRRLMPLIMQQLTDVIAREDARMAADEERVREAKEAKLAARARRLAALEVRAERGGEQAERAMAPAEAAAAASTVPSVGTAPEKKKKKRATVEETVSEPAKRFAERAVRWNVAPRGDR